jgi:hypothetical protein
VRFRWAALLALPAIGAGLLAHHVAVRGTTGASGRSFAQVERYSAGLGDLLWRGTRPVESVVYLGLTVLVLAVVGIAGLVRRRRTGLALTLGLGALVPSLLALGSNLPGYKLLWEHAPGLENTRVPERLMPVACLSLAALLAIAVSRVRWPGTALIVAVLLLVDLRLGIFHATAADEGNRAYAALRSEPPGRLLELPVRLPDDQSASVYLYYLMQAPREHPSGYSTTAPLAADRTLRELQQAPCTHLESLGVAYLVTQGPRPAPCRARLVARDGQVALYRR